MKKKIIRICVVVGVLGLCVLLCMGSRLTGLFETKIEYNTFLEQVEAGQVEEVNIDKTSGKVTYTLYDTGRKTYVTNYPDTEDFSEMLLTKGVKIKFHEESWLNLVLQYGMTPILMIFMYWYLKQTADIGTNGFEIEPVDKIQTRFSDVAGLDEIKEDLCLISEMMKNPEFRKSARIPRGVLLQGPPGNGKTLLARAFAGETGVNFIAVNACDFGSQFVGVGTNKINKVFNAAKEHAPCVVFIDEIDSVGAKRGSGSDAAGKEMNTMLTALLNRMDGFKQSDEIMVLAATNRVADLDAALVRPGRFDRQFVIDNPDKQARIRIFELYTKEKNIGEDVDFDRLAIRTYGYSASKIECIVNEAIILSIKAGRDTVLMQDFEDAILQMDIKGHIKKKYSQTEEERTITAYHEAGHATIAYFATNKVVTNVSIRPTTSGAGGFTLVEDKEENTMCPINDYRNEIKMLYAGRAAEVVLRGNIANATAGASQDIVEATTLAKTYVSIESGIDYSQFGEEGTTIVLEKTKELLKDVWDETLELVKTHWKDVEKIAKELLKNETIDEETLARLLQEKVESSSSN